MEWIFAGIDGTGVADNDEYAKEFAGSFVKRLRDEWSDQSLAFYRRGPTDLGSETKHLARLALQHVGSLYKPERAVVLAGYSRGAAAVIETAWNLSRYSSIPVDCLILFDSVDRSIRVGGLFANTPIAKNVKHCIHAIRSEATGSRSLFGGCGMEIEDQQATQYKYRHFFGTHGALGGTPWQNFQSSQRIDERRGWERSINVSVTASVTNVTGAQDAQCVRDVWAWTKNEIDTAFFAIERDRAQKLKPTG